MQLTDAEIREILIRKKKQKLRRRRRRRRRAILILILLIIIAVVAAIVIRKTGFSFKSDKSGDTEQAASAEAANARGIVFIDPGHGGDDPGSDDDKDRYEKDDTLRLSLAVRDYLQQAGFKVEMSRTEDENVERIRRGQMANETGSQLFVSVHRNKAATDGHGVEGFIPKKDDDQSRLLGENIMHALGRAGFTERTIRAGTLNDPAEDYEELSVTTMPSVLIEVGFLSSAEDNALFDDNLKPNAKAMSNAIELTFMSLYEPDKAAAYAKQIEAAENTSRIAVDTMKQAVENTVLAIDIMYGSDDEDEESGIDPQA